MKSVMPFTSKTRRSPEHVSNITVLVTFGALVALWAPIYLALLSRFGGGFVERTEALEWSLFIVGAFGLGGIVLRAWRDTRDPQWRAAHGLPLRKRS
jgi:hypothetical protein